MYINGIKCDVCNEIANNINPVKDGLPENWLDLRQENKATLHFCSLECLRLWIPKHPVGSEFAQDEPTMTVSNRVY